MTAAFALCATIGAGGVVALVYALARPLLACRWRAGLRPNPWLLVARPGDWAALEVCIDRDGVYLASGRRHGGFIRGRGFWSERLPPYCVMH